MLPPLASDKGFSWFQFQGSSDFVALSANGGINPPATTLEQAWKQHVAFQVLRRNERPNLFIVILVLKSLFSVVYVLASSTHITLHLESDARGGTRN